MARLVRHLPQSDPLARNHQESGAQSLSSGSRGNPWPNPPFRGDSTYLITGGLGGLGLVVADWMVKRGVRHLVLVGRSQPSQAVQNQLSMLTKAGAEVVVASADVCQKEQLADVLAQIDEARPLRGVIHAAGVLADGVLLQQNWPRFAKALAPKVQGAWNLHLLTASCPLDFFVLFSSSASLLGSAGQANYAAANAFLDTLATYRQSRGLPGLSINWGPWSKVGSAVKWLSQIKMGGMGAITPQEGLEVLAYLLSESLSQIGVVPIEWSQQRNKTPFFADFHTWQKQSPTEFRERFDRTPPDEQRALLEAYVREQVAKVLGYKAPLKLSQGFFELGMDSLTSIELKNRLQSSLGCRLSATLIFYYPTIERLVDHLAQDILLIGNEGASERRSLKKRPCATKRTKQEEVMDELDD